MFNKILIANRGEIAVRVIRACKELGITAAAVFSDADRTALHTILADESYYIGPSQASASYLNKEKIIEVAKQINADAIHPGYGFLSENPDFIKLVEDSGIIFIGPSSASVKMMGNKTEARALMKMNNVPIVPGTTKPIKNAEEGIQRSLEIGFPVLLKASAGGGGKGMRRINSKDEFIDNYDAVKRESAKAFANDDVYIEKLIVNPRHIEVQILGDKFGNYVHLFERECSIQRRHQKIIEEAPSPFVDDVTRDNITRSALNAAKACSYYNAGTIEFLMDSEKNFYFLEMNTRIQVEHPVTEMITSRDLVKEQIRIASGEKLSFTQNDLNIHCHAIEVRIYAEDPENNFLPSTGMIGNYSEPSGFGVRVDPGACSGSTVTMFYDPILSKLICWDSSRENVIKKALRALSEFNITGINTNLAFLISVLNNKNFIEGNFDINFLEREGFLLSNLTNQSANELHRAATIVAGILKLKTNVVPEKLPKIHNDWLSQNYE
ncbi:MAG: acetyl-CoA carboxylase biotin carboxylase subunit [Ignavibacteriaceae bacterium]|nr:acetyl-CoA carboxylase biotin carboxylase subunit [Ignavibacteriaceae bacterium]